MRAVDIGEWIVASFALNDHVVVKMDIEGAEHDLVRAMLRSGSFALIDTLLLECHSDTPPKCLRMVREIRQANPRIRLIHEARAFRELEDIDAESRVPNATDVARRVAACNSAAAGGFTLFQDGALAQRTDGGGGDGGGEAPGTRNEAARLGGAGAASAVEATPAAPSHPLQQGAVISDECHDLHAAYNRYPRRGPCPFDRHLVEQISYLDGCPPPGLRLCITPALVHTPPVTNPAMLPATNPDSIAAAKATASVNIDEALNDSAVEWRDFGPLRGFADVTFASKTGKVPGLLEPRGGQSWAGVEFPPEAARAKWKRYIARMANFVPLHAMRSAIDVGGGAGIFAAVLHQEFKNLSCITLTKDNSVGPRYHFGEGLLP